MTEDGLTTGEAPGRRRDSWSLKTIVEDIAGRPIAELQDPSRPPHPYLQVKMGSPSRESGPRGAVARSASEAVPEDDGTTDPIERVYPPLVGSTGRGLHGPEHEHHRATLSAMESSPEPPSPGRRPHAPGPSQRPERIYLHYLLLHMDRLSDPALRYLKHAVDDELRHRDPPAEPPASSS